MENPKIRFRMDNGLDYPHWGSKSFEEVFSPLNNNTFSRDMLNYEEGTAKSIHYGDILTTYGAICNVSSDVIPFVNEDIAYEKYDYLQNGDVILADTAEDETVGKAIELYGIKDETVISGLHTMACRPKQKYAPKYLGYLLNAPAFHNQLFPYMQGIKVTSIGRKNIASVKISYPCPAEQERIADFLSSVDEVIIQSEKEVQNLEQQKKAAMQKIFSQEICFKSNDGAEFAKWEEKTLGDFATVGVGNKPDSIEENQSGYEYINAGVTNSGYTSTFNCEGDIVTTPSRGQGGIGYVGYQKNKFWLGALCYGIRAFDKDVLTKYIYYSLSFNSTAILDLKKVGSVPAVNREDLIQVLLPIPCLEEQQKIADFLSAFDEAIDYAKQELEKWKELKKGLLQQMFV